MPGDFSNGLEGKRSGLEIRLVFYFSRQKISSKWLVRVWLGLTLVVDIYGTEDWVQKKDSYQRRLHLRGCLWSRDRCLVSSLGPRTVNLPFPPSLRDIFFLSKLVWNSIQMQIWRGLLSWTSAFPTRLIKQVWNGQMIRVSTVTTMCAQVGSGIRYKDGQRKGKAASQLSPLLPRTTSYSGWLVSKQHPKVD